MKNKIMKLIGIIAVVLAMHSCDYLEIVPENVATIDDAFTRPAEANNFLYSMYSFLPKVNDHMTYMQQWGTDEVVIPWMWYDAYMLTTQPMNTNRPFFDFWGNPTGHAYSYFEGIRQAYIFIDKIGNTPGFTHEKINAMRGEARFIIGYLHFLLLRQYGPTILIKEELPLNGGDDVIYPERAPFEEGLEFCVAQFDEAYTLVPDRRPKSDLGRVTKSVVAAMKARMLLYAASPLFNGNPDYRSFVGKNGEHLMPESYNKEKWNDAIEAYEVAIETAESAGLSLYAEEEDAIANTRFSVVEPWNSELIWGYKQEWYWSWQRHSAPRVIDAGAIIAAGGNAPTLRQVELYYTENGLPINQDPAYDYAGRFNVAGGDSTALLHRNREPRFYSNIAYDRGVYEINDGEQVMKFRLNEQDGFDGQDRTNYTRSGYLIKKLVHPQTEYTTTENIVVEYPWPVIRLAELYLGMAEALNEYDYGTTDKFGNNAIYYLDLVRERAGIPGVKDAWAKALTDKSASQEGLKEIIRTERNIELAFEGHRTWDVRRWKQGEKFNTPVYGLNIEAADASGFYKPVKIEDRYFDVNKSYLWPISLTELQKNTNLVQNPGY